MGKLGLTMIEGKADRLTFDVTVNGVNPGAVIPEGVQHPLTPISYGRGGGQLSWRVQHLEPRPGPRLWRRDAGQPG